MICPFLHVWYHPFPLIHITARADIDSARADIDISPRAQIHISRKWRFFRIVTDFTIIMLLNFWQQIRLKEEWVFDLLANLLLELLIDILVHDKEDAKENDR